MSRTGAELGENLAIPVFEEGKTKGQSNSKMPKDSFYYISNYCINITINNINNITINESVIIDQLRFKSVISTYLVFFFFIAHVLHFFRLINYFYGSISFSLLVFLIVPFIFDG